MNNRPFFSVLLVIVGVLVVGVVVTNQSAKNTALTQEEAYLETTLENASCLTAWDTSEVTSKKRASVISYSLDGHVVKVSHPYSYSTNQTDADSSSKATYLVSGNEAHLLERMPLNLPC